MVGKRWKILDSLGIEQIEIKNKIISELNCPDLVAELLVRKGLTESSEIRKFFKPKLEDMHDPYLFKDMGKAVDRILRAIENHEKITIYGDYDVDGTTSTSVLYLGLTSINAVVDYYIPHRMIDGYGLTLTGIDFIKENKTSLVITVDCGINGIDEIEQMNELGIDVIITDHHNPKEVLPNALAIINPKVVGSTYPDFNLAGVGVAYKLLMGVYKKLGMDTPENINKYLDLVALGTIADIVPLIGENRTFAYLGLKHILDKKNIGLNSLINLIGLSNKKIDANDIVFAIAPRINAAGRMGSAMRAVEMMISKDPDESNELAQIIERENSLRQQIDHKTFDEACEIIESKYKNLEETKCIVVSSDDWHPGVIGIVASKLVEKYYRPSFMITCNEGIGSGSGRSIAGFDLFEALKDSADLLESYGGHKYAAGLSIAQEYLDKFEHRINEYSAKHIPPKDFTPPLNLDYNLELYEITNNLMKWLNKFSPFGPKNMRPVFYTTKVMIVTYPYNVGTNHLKLKVMKDGCELNLIGFNLGGYLPLLKKNAFIDIAYTLDVVSWQGKKSIQGKLKDIAIVRSED